MLSRIRESVKKLEASNEFKEYKKNNPKSYLVSSFSILEEEDWEIDYYNPVKKLVTSFLVRERIKTKPESQAFQEREETISELDLKKVKIDLDKALEILENFRDKKYPNETADKKIIVLQNLKKFGQIWNITYLTNSFKTLNVKIDAEKGKILSEKLSSLISL